MSRVALKSITRLKWNTINIFLSKILTFMSFYVIGVKLNSRIYGIKSIAFIIIGLTDKCTQFRLSKGIRQKGVTSEDLDSLFWFNLILGVIATIIMILIVYPISIYFNFLIIFYLIALSSLSYLFKPMNLVFRTILQKDAKYKEIEESKVIKSVLTKLSLIFFIYLNFGIYSFAFSHIVGVASLTLYMFYTFKKNQLWLPSLTLNLNKAKKIYHFDRLIFLRNILNYIIENIHAVVIGFVFGYESLGVYNFAKNLLRNIGNTISQTFKDISNFIFKKAKKNKLKHFSQYYLTFVKIISLLIIPMSIFVAFFADDLLHFFFKYKWDEAIIMVRIFAIILVFDVFSKGFIIPGLYAFDKSRDVLIREMFFIPLGLTLLIITAFISAEAVAITYLIMVVIKTYSTRNLLNKICDITLKIYYKQMLSAVIISVLSIVGILIVKTLIPDLNIIYMGMVFSLAYMIMIILKEKQEFLLIKQLVTNKEGNITIPTQTCNRND
ncbi:MAG: oligosaccharide flippase family protein [Peptococcia bacterium]